MPGLVQDATNNDLTYRVIGAAMTVHNRMGPATRRRCTNGRWQQSCASGRSPAGRSTDDQLLEGHPGAGWALAQLRAAQAGVPADLPGLGGGKRPPGAARPDNVKRSE